MGRVTRRCQFGCIKETTERQAGTLVCLIVLARLSIEEGGTQWPKSHARTRAVRARQNRGRSFARPIAERQKQALPAPVATRDAE